MKLELNRRDKDPLYTYIDLEDLQRVVIDFPYTWFAGWDSHSHSFYVKCTIHKKELFNGLSQMNINTYIMNPNFESGIQVDHIDHDTLNNRKSNLRCANYVGNGTHRSGANSNNTTGYRNVIKLHGWYQVQLQIDGENKPLAKFKDVNDAGAFAELMRQKYYGEFAGNG